VVIQAHLVAQATNGKESQQRQRKQKLNIMKMIYDRGYSRQEVTDLYRFVDWVLTLPPDLAEALKLI
jgi:predicted Ser/Thr protein kinase